MSNAYRTHLEVYVYIFSLCMFQKYSCMHSTWLSYILSFTPVTIQVYTRVVGLCKTDSNTLLFYYSMLLSSESVLSH